VFKYVSNWDVKCVKTSYGHKQMSFSNRCGPGGAGAPPPPTATPPSHTSVNSQQTGMGQDRCKARIRSGVNLGVNLGVKSSVNVGVNPRCKIFFLV